MKNYRGEESIVRAALHLQAYCSNRLCGNCMIKEICDKGDSLDEGYKAIWRRLLKIIGRNPNDYCNSSYPRKKGCNEKHIKKAAEHLAAYCLPTYCKDCKVQGLCEGLDNLDDLPEMCLHNRFERVINESQF